MTSIETRGRARLVALRIVASVFVLIGLVGVNGGLVLPFVSWLPDATLTAIGLPPGDLFWLVQGTGIGLGNIMLLVGVALQIVRPTANVAPLWMVAFLMGVQMVYDATQGTVGASIWWVVYALTIALVVLHPRRVAPLPPWNWVAVGVAALGAGPLLVYAWDELRQQDPANGNNFHFGMALVAALVVVATVAGSSSAPGHRVVAGLGGLTASLLGVVSIAKPALPSAFPTGWAWAALVWGIVFVIVSVRPVALKRRPAGSLAPTPAP